MSFQQQNDGWQTVRRPVFGLRREEGGSRSTAAPAAFGGGKPDRGRQATEARAAFHAAEMREKKQAEDVAAKRETEATNFTSESSYPTLGAVNTPVHRPTLNYKQVVKDMIAKETEAQLAAAAAAAEAEYTEATALREGSSRPATTYSRQRILDELEDDYDGPEEDDAENEMNAEIDASRRRGDKGIW